MFWRRICNGLRIFCALAFLTMVSSAMAAEYRGQVSFGGLPVPGATLTATQGGKHFDTTSDQQGVYSFPDLTDGKWTIEVHMTGFAPLKQDVVISPNAPPGNWDLKLLPLGQVKAEVNPTGAGRAMARAGTGQGAPSSSPATLNATKRESTAGSARTAPKPRATGEDNKTARTDTPEDAQSQRAEDGFLVNGSVNNAATSPFALAPGFGNNRNGGKSSINYTIGLKLDNSALDARPFSLSGQSTPKPDYSRITGFAALGGRIKIPHFVQHSPNFFVAYQWTRDLIDTTSSVLVPSVAERGGDFSQTLNALGQPVQIFNPTTGMPFSSNMISPTQISSQAMALLNYYPLPTFSGNPRYNYQVPINTSTHQDAVQSRLDESINPRNQIFGGFAFQSVRTATPNLFGFLDTTSSLGINTNINWQHQMNSKSITLGYSFSRLATRVTPYWENRSNVSGEAGITGNDQDPTDWGPPSLSFSSGIAGLSDGLSSFNRNQTSALSASLVRARNRHNITLGGDFRRQQFNYLSQQNPRGTLTFTGAVTEGGPGSTGAGGYDFADFLLGIPDTSSIAFGNADKYFRESVYDAYFQDDWRIRPEFTLNAGIRWEYGAPITEIYDRLVNLDITPGFAAISPVLASNPTGPLTGQHYPNSLVHPDKHAFEPRVGIAWRPIPGSSLLVRGGYGVYYDTSVYQTIAQQMAQQAPLSKSLSVQNSSNCPLTLANPFNTCPSITPDTYAVDPNFRVGYAQNWQASVQRDLPGSLQMLVTYLGTKGTRGVQDFLPNTYPIGAVNPCPACPTGFTYLTSNGNSTWEAGQLQLRRRLHSGFTASVRYTFSKAIDDDSAVGGQGAVQPAQNLGAASGANGGLAGATPAIAQNWLDLKAERGLSSFDQRHLLNLQVQYTTGMGLAGNTLLSGWRGTLWKEWTCVTQIKVGSGLPETPLYFAAVPGTGVTNNLRPDSTGAPLYAAPSGLYLNPAAYSAPLAGQWGTAGRDSIIGPTQFSLNTSMGRTFRLDRFTVDLRFDSTNFLNHPAFTSWYTTTTSAQFGLPSGVSAARTMQATLRLRF